MEAGVASIQAAEVSTAGEEDSVVAAGMLALAVAEVPTAMAAAGLVDTVALALIGVAMVLIVAVMVILVAALHSGVATKVLVVEVLGIALAGDIRTTSVVLVETGTSSRGNRVILLGQISMGIGEILVV
jgi:hypothetical protein